VKGDVFEAVVSPAKTARDFLPCLLSSWVASRRKMWTAIGTRLPVQQECVAELCINSPARLIFSTFKVGALAAAGGIEPPNGGIKIGCSALPVIRNSELSRAPARVWCCLRSPRCPAAVWASDDGDGSRLLARPANRAMPLVFKYSAIQPRCPCAGLPDSSHFQPQTHRRQDLHDRGQVGMPAFPSKGPIHACP
jgi:hypothetical protein